MRRNILAVHDDGRELAAHFANYDRKSLNEVPAVQVAGVAKSQAWLLENEAMTEKTGETALILSPRLKC